MENYVVSARKYRPSTFRSVVGQKALTQTLKNAIDSQKLAHAYLFCGPRGVGKTTCARIFAKTINCLHPTEQGEACNECESCVAFNEQRSYNIMELDAASNNSVDDIRQLTEQVRIAPQVGRYKVFIIDEVHMLSSQAFNAFLKTLEEPPHHAIFILATTEKNKILPTILSRCQIYDFQRITISDTVEHLQYVAEQEGIEAEVEGLNVIAQKADGGMRDALSIFDQIVSSTQGHITYASVIDNLNVLDYENYFKLTDAFLQSAVPAVLLGFDEILRNGFDAQYFVSGLSGHFRNLLVCKDASTLPLLEVAPSVAERYGQQAARCSTDFLYKAMNISNECDLAYRASNNKRLLVELMLIKLCQLSAPAQPAAAAEPPLQKVVPVTPSAQPQAPAGSARPSAPSSAQPVQQAAPAQPAQPPVQPSPASAAAAVPPVQQPASPAARPGRDARPAAPTRKVPVSISIKGTQAAAPEQTRQEPVRLADMNTPFTDEALAKAWTAFIQTIPTETVLINTIISCQPQRLSDTRFEVVVDNQTQLRLVQERMPAILSFVQSAVKNTHFEIAVRESERAEKQKAFSPREKLALMAQKNPYVRPFTESFGLELA